METRARRGVHEPRAALESREAGPFPRAENPQHAEHGGRERGRKEQDGEDQHSAEQGAGDDPRPDQPTASICSPVRPKRRCRRA